MPLHFNTLMQAEGLDPLSVRLLRHQDTRSSSGRTVYRLWREDRETFEVYQSRHDASQRTRLSAKYWAAFARDFDGLTVFIGIYEIGEVSASSDAYVSPLSGQVHAAEVDVYATTLTPHLAEHIGRLFVDWGRGTRGLAQRADRQNKPIVELRRQVTDPAFPGFTRLIANLSEVANFPKAWRTALESVGGVYLLTCPRTQELYVGSATGANGLYGRWMDYVRDGHGGNVVLKSREPSDYQITVLEVVGSSATQQEALALEELWKRKLRTRELGLNAA